SKTNAAKDFILCGIFLLLPMEFLRWLLPYFPEKYRQSDSRFSDKWKERVECCKKTEIKNSDNYELSLTLVLKKPRLNI
ncbi:MAG: hypothetical protein ABS878_03640, partial [Priestia megaterium]